MEIKVYNSKRFAEYKKEYARRIDSVEKSRRLWYEAMDAVDSNPTDKTIDKCQCALSKYESSKNELYAYMRTLVETVLFSEL